MNKKWIWGLTAAMILAAVGFYYITTAKADESETIESVQETAVVTQGDIIIDFVSDGHVEIPIYDLSFETTGRVESVNVKVGDYVEAGSVLAELEKEALERSLLEAQLDLEAALKQQALNASEHSDDEQNYAYQSKVLWATYVEAQDKLEVMQALSAAYPAREIEDQQTAVDDAYAAYSHYVGTSRPNTPIHAELDAITVEKARMRIDEIGENMNGMIITANVSGWVAEVNYAAGEVTQSSEPVVLIEEDGPIYVRTNVPEEDIGDVRVGQKATFEADAVPGITYAATVVQVSRAPQVGANGLVSYEVLLQAAEKDRQLMDGMTSTVHFILIEKTEVLVLPNEALSKKDGGQYVTVRLENGTLQEQKVFAGFTDGSQVEILSGLDAGTTVVYEK